jgi:hypothetical protein
MLDGATTSDASADADGTSHVLSPLDAAVPEDAARSTDADVSSFSGYLEPASCYGESPSDGCGYVAVFSPERIFLRQPNGVLVYEPPQLAPVLEIPIDPNIFWVPMAAAATGGRFLVQPSIEGATLYDADRSVLLPFSFPGTVARFTLSRDGGRAGWVRSTRTSNRTATWQVVEVPSQAAIFSEERFTYYELNPIAPVFSPSGERVAIGQQLYQRPGPDEWDLVTIYEGATQVSSFAQGEPRAWLSEDLLAVLVPDPDRPPDPLNPALGTATMLAAVRVDGGIDRRLPDASVPESDGPVATVNGYSVYAIKRDATNWSIRISKP